MATDVNKLITNIQDEGLLMALEGTITVRETKERTGVEMECTSGSKVMEFSKDVRNSYLLHRAAMVLTQSAPLSPEQLELEINSQILEHETAIED